ncbi:TonB-dependent receptor [Pleionea litopenaei]|uniref:TonB-dependent receptor n=1 Tax=Pleionea litopenaei TaxID=3070815 RepID=A0AA51RVX1_9GAMM|nr:TonB-dependent receptor [Pleionea sp. HL-JVS1]WMS88439.1 TonB-dependent receptor [Pleionea sp. HL-JVS1]
MKYATIPFALAAVSGFTGSIQADTTKPADEEVKVAEEVVVYGEIGYRNRSNEINQTLEYDQEYFQRFEPLTAGDALKRIPSVTFLSDVIESDGARMRGLSPGYTQILINGEQVPGSGSDRSFFLDRIPAELIERVEVVRANSANRSGDAIAGTLNIVLRDGFSLDGGYIRAGGLKFSDNEMKESISAIWGGKVGSGRLIVGYNHQGRYNPKQKTSLRYGDSPENNPNYQNDDFDNRETQSDVRDGTDRSLNINYSLAFGENSSVELYGFFVNTDREEIERSFEYNDPSSTIGLAASGGNLETDNANNADIEQRNFSVGTKLTTPWLGGIAKFKATVAKFDEFVFEWEDEIDTSEVPFVFEEERTIVDLVDDEHSLSWSQSYSTTTDQKIEFGLFAQEKERYSNILESEDEREVSNNWDPEIQSPNNLALHNAPFQSVPSAHSNIEETRADAFFLVKQKMLSLSWEVGVRYESTKFSIEDLSLSNAPTIKQDYSFALPSAHIQYQLDDNDRLHFSVAKSVRRPNFDYLTPALIEKEFGDNDLQGNPFLKPETSVGLDFGIEHRIGQTGVVGLNVFYRKINDLIELTNTGIEGSEGPSTFVLKPENLGDGTVKGVELDLSTPLSIINLENTGVFLNYSVLDSEVDDLFGKRTFNDQAKNVYNLGFIQDLPDSNTSFGLTYRKQGSAYGRIIGEEVTTSYGADLELFIEKRWDNLTLRLVGSNLLDAEKREAFNKFDTIDDQLTRNFDEFELEQENAGSFYQLMLRYAF